MIFTAVLLACSPVYEAQTILAIAPSGTIAASGAFVVKTNLGYEEEPFTITVAGASGSFTTEPQPLLFFTPQSALTPGATYQAVAGPSGGAGTTTWTVVAEARAVIPLSVVTPTTVTVEAIDFELRQCTEAAGGLCSCPSKVVGTRPRHVFTLSKPVLAGDYAAVARAKVLWSDGDAYWYDLSQPLRIDRALADGTPCAQVQWLAPDNTVQAEETLCAAAVPGTALERDIAYLPLGTNESTADSKNDKRTGCNAVSPLAWWVPMLMLVWLRSRRQHVQSAHDKRA